MKLGEEAWNRWATAMAVVKDDLQGTVNDQAVFQGFSEVVRANEPWIEAQGGGYFCQFVARAYVARVALGVRRQVKDKKDSHSLIRIMSQMADCARQLTFDFYMERFPREPNDVFLWQRPTFKLVSEDGKVASKALISRDIHELRSLTERVEAFVDKQIAHLDRKRLLADVTFNDLDVAIGKLDDLACKYVCLLTGKSYSSLQATVQFDWKRIFSVPFNRPA